MDQNQDDTAQFPQSPVDEKTFIVSRTVQSVEEATIVTSSNGVEEETATNDQAVTTTNTNPSFGGPVSNTQSGITTFGVTEESDPGAIPELITSPIPTQLSTLDAWGGEVSEPVIEREVVAAYVAPEVIENRPKQREDEFIEVVAAVIPDKVEKSNTQAPSNASDASKLYRKNQNRAQMNSVWVIVSVVVGFALIGSTIAILIANLK